MLLLALPASPLANLWHRKAAAHEGVFAIHRASFNHLVTYRFVSVVHSAHLFVRFKSSYRSKETQILFIRSSASLLSRLHSEVIQQKAIMSATATPATPESDDGSSSPSSTTVEAPASPVQTSPDVPRRPAEPRIWSWRCKCGHQYSLGITNRCLFCSHRMCNTKALAGQGTLSNVSIDLSPEGIQRTKVQQSSLPTPIKRRDPLGKIRKHRECKTKFDFKGWSKWQIWRREVLAAQMIYHTAESMAVTARDGAEEAADESDVARLARQCLAVAPGTMTWLSGRQIRRREKLRELMVKRMGRQRHTKMRTGLHDCSVDCD